VSKLTSTSTLVLGCTSETTREPSGRAPLAAHTLPCPTHTLRPPAEADLVCFTTPSVRSSIPLATSPLESGYPEISLPAPATLVLSQHFGGLLLRLVCLSYFIQAPPMGFKERGRTQRAMFCFVSRNPLVRANSALDVSYNTPQNETRDDAFNRSIQRQECHDCCVDAFPSRDPQRSYVPSAKSLTQLFRERNSGEADFTRTNQPQLPMIVS